MSRNKKSHLVKQKIKHWPTPQEIKKKNKNKKEETTSRSKKAKEKKNEHKKKKYLKLEPKEKKKKKMPTYWTKPHVQVHIGILVNKQIKLPPCSFLPILGRKISGGPK